MANTFLDDFIDKMVIVPNDVNRHLRLIRKLDKWSEELQATLIPLQNKVLAHIKELKDKKITQVPPQLKADQELVMLKQMQLYGYAKQKLQISRQLQQEVQTYHSMLAQQMKNKYKDKPEEYFANKKRMKDANKINVPAKKDDFYYDKNQPIYCYCGQIGHGEMVACQNPYCEREWFHLNCILEKNLPEKWYCADCQKQREKTRNNTSRGYFTHKELSS